MEKKVFSEKVREVEKYCAAGAPDAYAEEVLLKTSPEILLAFFDNMLLFPLLMYDKYGFEMKKLEEILNALERSFWMGYFYVSERPHFEKSRAKHSEKPTAVVEILRSENGKDMWVASRGDIPRKIEDTPFRQEVKKIEEVLKSYSGVSRIAQKLMLTNGDLYEWIMDYSSRRADSFKVECRLTPIDAEEFRALTVKICLLGYMSAYFFRYGKHFFADAARRQERFPFGQSGDVFFC